MAHLTRYALLAMVLVALPADHTAPVSAGDAARRVAFRIRTLLGPDGARETASDATVEGPPGTDITLGSRAGQFRMTAKLKTDLVDRDRVRVVADVTTRRLAGTSERGLPLYEEDVQRRAVELATDGSESLVVLPFGRNPGGDELALDILPSLTERPVENGSGKVAPLEIHIANQGPGGWLEVEASRVPHRYRVDASLERDGRVVAAGSSRCELGEAGRIPLAPPGAAPVAELRLTVTGYANTCPTDRIDVTFDLAAAGSEAPLARGWAGVGSSSEPLAYDLGALGARLPGEPASLRLRVIPEELP
jgi:hypothetical protein